MKFGKLPPKQDPRTLQFARYVSPVMLPRVLPSYDVARFVERWPIFKNDQEGDCTAAAAGHMDELSSAIAGRPRVLTDADIQSFYDATKVPGGEGAFELDVLRYWRSTGLAGHKILAFASLSPRSHTHIKLALSIFKGIYIGLALPESAQSQVGQLWDFPLGQKPVGPYAPGSWGGHAVNVVSYDADTVTCVTWGALQRMSWRFWGAYVDEAYAVIPDDFIGGLPGFDFAKLRADLSKLGGEEA